MATALVITAIVLRLMAGLGYLVATLRGRVKPSAVSWFFWGLTPMITLAVQIQQHVGIQALVTLALGIGPLAVFITTIRMRDRRITFTPADIACAVLAAMGLTLWFITSNPALAIICGILGDFFSAVPTLRKSYRHPETEHALPYFLSMLAMVAATCAIADWSFIRGGFTLYMLIINLVFVVLIFGRLGVRRILPNERRRPAAITRRQTINTRRPAHSSLARRT